MLEELGATSAYPITPFQWMSSDRLSLPGPFPKIVAKASRLTFPHLWPMGRFSRALFSLGLLALAWISQGRITRRIETLTKGSDCVIWDATMLRMEYNKPLLHLFRDVPSFSISHGLGLTKGAKFLRNWKPPERIIAEKTTVLATSLNDIAQLQKVTGVAKKQIKFTGIYRHHPDWIRVVTSQESENEEVEERDTLLLIGRGHSSENGYLPRERKIGYLEDIKTVAEQFNLHVVVKPHPKESNLSIYSEAFGSQLQILSWEISDLHLMILAQKALFGVSFLSDSCLDLTACGVPTIERLNLVGLRAYDSRSAIRDSAGRPIFPMRQNGHVLGSSTSEEFFLQVEEVVNNRRQVMRQLREAYSNQFITPPMSPSALARQISDSCVEFSQEESNHS